MEELVSALKRTGAEKHYWQPDSRILLAVSGGVDSMVLLEVMRQVQTSVGFELAVAHVDHGLRQESQQEAAFLQVYCQKRQLPFYCERWQTPTAIGMEAAAREFRYDFFERVMTSAGYDILMTAHHQDDQAETVLMKLLRGGSLAGHRGILSVRRFAGGRLLRPLLPYSKTELQAVAEQRQLPFFEDSSNLSRDYHRNRLRLDILPRLNAENPQSSRHLAEFGQQLGLAADFIQEQMSRRYQQLVSKSAAGYSLAATDVAVLSEAERYYFWDHFFQEMLKEQGVTIKQKQLQQLLKLLRSEKAQWQMSFENGWVLVKEYQQLRFCQQKKGPSLAVAGMAERTVGANGLYLDEQMWLAIAPAGTVIEVPLELASWATFCRHFQQPVGTSFAVRKRQDGDRIRLTQSLTKRLSRYLIDQKVAASDRASAWVLLDGQKNVLGLLPLVFSYLSIATETDTIQYTLICKYKNVI